jgi:pyruvate formate lyase activating enzyme
VVFSGGEPTLQADLPDAMREVRALGFKIGLHTGGMYPQRLEAVLPLIDWVGMDVKAPFADYPRTTSVAGSGERAFAGLQQVLASGVDHEIRTTVHPALLRDADLADMARDLAARGVKHYVIQAFRSQGCRDEGLLWNTVRGRPLQEVGTEFAGLFEDFLVRA